MPSRLRERANATVYQLVATGDGPDNANGQAWFSVQGSGELLQGPDPEVQPLQWLYPPDEGEYGRVGHASDVTREQLHVPMVVIDETLPPGAAVWTGLVPTFMPSERVTS